MFRCRRHTFIDNSEFIKFWNDYINTHIWEGNETFNIYIDFPFCRSRCLYCIFGSASFYKDKNIISRYEKAVIDNIIEMKNVLSIRTPDNIYFGGGTPTLWSFNSLMEIINNIPNYDTIGVRKSEAHPYDLNQDRMDFMINEMKLNDISVGVQSFNYNSNISQKRIPIRYEKINEAVKYFQSHGIYVNIDLVALFNGDTERDWEIFIEDLNILGEIVKPDYISANPNFKIDNYYEHSIRFRMILSNFLEKYPQYSSSIQLSLDMDDIKSFRTRTYFLSTARYNDFINKYKPYIMRGSHSGNTKPSVLGFGGWRQHPSISCTANTRDFFTYYDPVTDEFSRSFKKI